MRRISRKSDRERFRLAEYLKSHQGNHVPSAFPIYAVLILNAY